MKLFDRLLDSLEKRRADLQMLPMYRLRVSYE
jgi:hypothetical protein